MIINYIIDYGKVQSAASTNIYISETILIKGL